MSLLNVNVNFGGKKEIKKMLIVSNYLKKLSSWYSLINGDITSATVCEIEQSNALKSEMAELEE